MTSVCKHGIGAAEHEASQSAATRHLCQQIHVSRVNVEDVPKARPATTRQTDCQPLGDHPVTVDPAHLESLHQATYGSLLGPQESRNLQLGDRRAAQVDRHAATVRQSLPPRRLEVREALDVHSSPALTFRNASTLGLMVVEL